MEAHPIPDENKFPQYSLTIGINSLAHFEIDMGVTNDGGGLGYEDGYEPSRRTKSATSSRIGTPLSNSTGVGTAPRTSNGTKGITTVPWLKSL